MKVQSTLPRIDIKYIGTTMSSTETISVHHLPGSKIDTIIKGDFSIEKTNFCGETRYKFCHKKQGDSMWTYFTATKKEIADLISIVFEMRLHEQIEAEYRASRSPRFIPPFRVGKSTGRAVLDADGHEVVLFPEGSESLAADYVERLNKDNKPLW